MYFAVDFDAYGTDITDNIFHILEGATAVHQAWFSI
ncbi:hypothetical protein [Siminovitchia terrae]|nr:hypothetical protein [Siminovitchia terrae]